MGIHYEEPYYQAISFYADLPVELDPNAIEYLPLQMLDTFDEPLPMNSTEPGFDKVDPTTPDVDLELLGPIDDNVKLYRGLWIPELNGYTSNNPTHLEISEDFSNFGENPGGNFIYNYLSYVPTSQNFNEISKISDQIYCNNSQSVRNYPTNYNPNYDQTDRLGIYQLSSEPSDFTNENLWVSNDNGYAQNSQPFSNQVAFYKEQICTGMPQKNFYQNSPYQTCINGNFNTVNVPNNYDLNNFINYTGNNFAAAGLVSNNFASNNYGQANYGRVNYVNSQAFQIPAPMNEFTYKNPNNSRVPNNSSHVNPSYKFETQVRPKVTRNLQSNSSRKPSISRMQSNKGYNVITNNPNENALGFNNQNAPEFHSYSTDNYTRPPYVREFAKCSEDYGHPATQNTTKFHDRSSFRKPNQSHHNSRGLKSHPYKQPSKEKGSDMSLTVKDRQLKENASFPKPNSKETSFQSKGQQQSQTKLCDGLTSSK